jgi:hypothetical protein
MTDYSIYPGLTINVELHGLFTYVSAALFVQKEPD